ncbi:unnamed protein product [Gongylonema pulchrum]|uniref:Uncharacterized protein n=1 Tax=Gongylonema pulchrum TaxID=637853 RepID=A0A183EE20_9BILA|nr:unnamed protein product [Gongylonema pulchrum]
MDGIFNNRRLFVAPRNGAVLVSGDRLRDPRNVSILDGDPTFSAYVCTPPQHQYRDDFSFSSATHSDADSYRNHPSQRIIDINVNITDQPKNQIRYGPPGSRTSLVRESSRNLAETGPAKPAVCPETVRCEFVRANTQNVTGLYAWHLPCAYFRLKSNEGGLMDGDRIVWFDAEGIPRRGTVRWCGYLRGHTKVYVGVDFVSFFFLLLVFIELFSLAKKKKSK